MVIMDSFDVSMSLRKEVFLGKEEGLGEGWTGTSKMK